MRFPKTDRVLKREEFRRIYQKGHKVQARYFTAFIMPSEERQSRIGITVTRKFGKSVKRNRARRLLREVFRNNKWLVPPGVDIVINVKAPLVEAGYREIEGDFITFLERVSDK